MLRKNDGVWCIPFSISYGVCRRLSKHTFAVDPHYQAIGEMDGVTPQEIQFAKDAWNVSDLIIRYDYFGKSGRTVGVPCREF